MTAILYKIESRRTVWLKKICRVQSEVLAVFVRYIVIIDIGRACECNDGRDDDLGRFQPLGKGIAHLPIALRETARKGSTLAVIESLIPRTGLITTGNV